MIPSTRRWHDLLLVLLLILPGVARAEEGAAGGDAAVSVIERWNGTLLDIMRRAEELGYQGRYELVAPVVRETFDIVFMARQSVGRHWKKLSPGDRERWVETFAAFTVSTFADRFDGYSGEAFEIVGRKPASHQTLVVRTRLVRPDADDVALDYRMREEKAGWRVVDVYSGGKVSEVALRRSEYASVLRKGGIEKLIASVSTKTARRARN